jgi:hypothetical protein
MIFFQKRCKSRATVPLQEDKQHLNLFKKINSEGAQNQSRTGQNTYTPLLSSKQRKRRLTSTSGFLYIYLINMIWTTLASIIQLKNMSPTGQQLKMQLVMRIASVKLHRYQEEISSKGKVLPRMPAGLPGRCVQQHRVKQDLK